MNIPSRIILSRKGFDSTSQYGGRPSPVHGGRILSIPIPEDTKKTIKYSALLDPTGQFPNLGSIVEQLPKGKFTAVALLTSIQTCATMRSPSELQGGGRFSAK